MRPHESNLSHRMLFIGFALTTFNVQNLKKKVGQSLLSVEFPLRRDNYLTVEFGDIWPGLLWIQIIASLSRSAVQVGTLNNLH